MNQSYLMPSLTLCALVLWTHTALADPFGRIADEAANHPIRNTLQFEGFDQTVDSAQSRSRFYDGGVRYTKLAFNDVVHVASFPIRWNGRQWLTASLAVAAIGLTSTIDDPVRDLVQHNRSKSFDEVVGAFEPFGAEYSPIVLGGFLATGIVLKRPKERAVAFDGFVASVIAAQNITPFLKHAFGRSRPFQREEVYHFEPFGSDDSFPSGHTTRAFTMAGVIAAHYDSDWIKAAAYGSASMIGMARIVHNVHYLSDVAAGAMIGISVGRSIVHFNNNEREQHEQLKQSSTQLSLAPLRNGAAVVATMTF